MSQSDPTQYAALELGKLYYERCDFDVAVEKLTSAAKSFFESGDLDQFLNCQNYLLRIYAEREDSESIRTTKELLQDLVLNKGFELTAKTYYTLGVCASHKDQDSVAQDYFQKSLALALAADNKRDVCFAIFGLARVYFSQDRIQDAMKEIYNLQVLFQVMPIPELQLASQMLNAHIFRKLKKHDQALELLWQSYDLLREMKNIYIYVVLLHGMALTYKESGELDLARMYFMLAKKTADPKNLVMMTKAIDQQLSELGVAKQDEFDLIFDSGSNSITERKKGRVDFKNQFILLDMLRLFMRHPGQVYSKEQLVKVVWKQEYDPAVHDNKIYVTIKRLRKLIEPDYDKPKYIFRAKNGYYLNKNTRVHLDH